MAPIDWTEVVREPCPECGFDAAGVNIDSLGASLAEEATTWVDLLTENDTDSLRQVPEPGVWCALEYAAHVRDVFALFADRVVRILTVDEPVLDWWDHEAAAVDEGYRDQEPVEVAAAVAFNAERLLDVVATVPDVAWERRATRRPGEEFTLVELVRFALHESVHHRGDAVSSLTS